jgi:addiction module RelE/StbE family toxin
VTPIVWSPESVRDLEAIRAYIAEDSARYAELVVGRIVAAVERLGEFPKSGRIVPERNDEGIREIIVQPYRVVYRFRSSVVEIATVFRASRMFPEDV